MKVKEALDIIHSHPLRFADPRTLEAAKIVELHSECIEQVIVKLPPAERVPELQKVLEYDIGQLGARVERLKRKPAPRPAGRRAWAQ